MNTGILIRRAILGLILIGALTGFWYFTISHSFVQLTLPSGTDKAEVTNSQTGRTITTRASSGWINLPTGDYVITYYQAGQATNMQFTHIGPLSVQSVKPSQAQPGQKPLTVLNHAADLVTPLGNGYLYLDKATRGLSYADAAGTTDISARFHLTTNPGASLAVSDQSILNTVIGLEPVTGGGVVVTTTRGVFTASSPTNITQLPVFPTANLNHTSSAYDRQTGSLFVLSSYSKTLYRYNLNKPAAAPAVFYQGKLELNRLAAGGGKVVAYFDSVPSTEPAVLAQYAFKRQLNPLVIDADGQLIKELTGFQPATYLSVSASGNYLAIKKKLAGSITIYDLASNKTTTIPSHDTGGAGWRGDTFYLARDNAIWSYNTIDDDGLTKVAGTNAPVTRLVLTPSQTILTTNQNTTASLEKTGATKTPVTVPSAPGTPDPARYIYYAPPPETGR